jgi:hypothetical protein
MWREIVAEQGLIMAEKKPKMRHYPDAQQDSIAARRIVRTPQTLSPSYRLAFVDADFLLRDELRSVRLQLELLKPELLFQEYNIEHTIVVFGSARIPPREQAQRHYQEILKRHQSKPGDEELQQQVIIAQKMLTKTAYYEEAVRLGRLIADNCMKCSAAACYVMTGGGPGIMEAANRGASEGGAKTIGLNIVLPHEQRPNPYITPELCLQFHYFAMRKMHFLIRAKALVAFPGGFGTMDELFEALTLIQTGKITPIPVILFGREFWKRAVNFDFLVEEGVISPEDLNLFSYVETAEQAWEIISNYMRSLNPAQNGQASQPTAPDAEVPHESQGI